MSEPGGLNLEAFKNSILAMMDELVIKQAEKFNFYSITLHFNKLILYTNI